MGPGLARYYQKRFTEIMLKELKKETLTLFENRTYEKILSVFQVKTVLKYQFHTIKPALGGQRPQCTRRKRYGKLPLL